MSVATERIRQLNDAHRQGIVPGQWIVTSGVEALGPEALRRIVGLVIAFNDFNEDNDPHGEHDFGSFSFAGETIYWKIDYYDLARQYYSPDPANPDLTRRVLTILLASEY